ncbi:MAG: hypothetical protein KC421_30735, partial [Anaerolineales bacterium]|nr:hypothetical protein [Anaerolineales bacterium]
MTHVLVTAPFPEHLLDKIRAVSPQIKLEVVDINGRIWPEDRQTAADIMYSVLWQQPQPQQTPNLKWIQVHSAGVDFLREQPVWDSDIFVTTTSGIHAPNMAQYVMTQILAWTHHVPKWLHYQQRGEWPQQRWQKFVPQELRGQTLGILGYGSIGREVARLAKAFGMKVLVTKRDVL